MNFPPPDLLFSRYDVYITGLRGASASAGAVGVGGGGGTDIVNAESGVGGSDVEVERRRRMGAGLGTAIKDLTGGNSGRGALERALQQLAALGGESMANRMNVSEVDVMAGLGHVLSVS